MMKRNQRTNEMLRNTAVLLLLALLPALLMACQPVQTTQQEAVQAPVEAVITTGEDGLPYGPITKPDGSPFSLGFIDLDPYPYTAQMLYDVVEGLKADGWIRYGTLPFDHDNTDAQQLVRWLSQQDLGPYLRFRDDANYYTLVDDPDEVRASYEQHAQARDIDLMLAWSTSTARYAIEYADAIPVIAYPIADPLGSGIVLDAEYSGINNVWAHTDPARYRRQMMVFHEVVPFTKVGIIYYEESIAAVPDYTAMSNQLGIETVLQKVDPLQADMTEEQVTAYYENYISVCRRMIEQSHIDAFILTTDMIKNDDYLHELVKLFTDAKIPIFAQSGGNFVEAGCLMTVEALDSKDVGRFVANSIGKVLNGAKPSELNQMYVSTPYLMLNVDASRALNIDLPFEMLISCERIYQSGE